MVLEMLGAQWSALDPGMALEMPEALRSTTEADVQYPIDN
jgi:hypothetical protein